MERAERPVRLDGLQVAGLAGILTYEVVKHAPALQGWSPLAQRAAFAGSHGFLLLVLVAAFAWARPLLAMLHDGETVRIEPLRFAAIRWLRIAPAYWVVAALTIALPFVAARYGATTFAGAGNAPGNDVFWAASIALRLAIAFPFALALYVRAPRIFAFIAVAAVFADLFTAAHRIDAGAFGALAAAIVAADPRLAKFARHAAGAAIALAVTAFSLDPLVAGLAGPRLGGIENWDPLWIGALSCALVTARNTGPLASFFSRSPLREIAAAGRMFLERLYSPAFTLSFAHPAPSSLRIEERAWLAVTNHECTGDLAMVVKRMGSADDLAGEMQRAAQRSAESAIVATYARYAEPIVEPIVVEPIVDDAGETEPLVEQWHAFADATDAEFVEVTSEASVACDAVTPPPQRETRNVIPRPPDPEAKRRPTVRLQIGPAWEPTRV